MSNETINNFLHINSVDRDSKIYSSPFNFTIVFSDPTSNIQKTFKNVKYVGFENVLFPHCIQINKFLLTDNDMINELLDFFINNQNININDQYSNLNYLKFKSIEICNKDSKTINFTLNEYSNKCYEWIIDNNTFNYYIPVFTCESDSLQYINFKEINNPYIASTKNKLIYKYFYPKIRQDSEIYQSSRKSYVTYKNNELVKLSRLSIELLDINMNLLTVNNFDYNCNNNGIYGKNYYIRHPLNPKFQLELFLNVGTIEKNLSLIN